MDFSWSMMFAAKVIGGVVFFVIVALIVWGLLK